MLLIETDQSRFCNVIIKLGGQDLQNLHMVEVILSVFFMLWTGLLIQTMFLLT